MIELIIFAFISLITSFNPATTAGDFIKESEGLNLIGYYANDYEEERNIVTIGWGSTFRNVVVGEEITHRTCRSVF